MPRPALLAALALLAGCETFVEPDPADYDPVLDVRAVFEPGVPWSVDVALTVPINGEPSRFPWGVPTATVTVTADDGTAVVLPRVPGDEFRQGLYGAVPIYRSGLTPIDAPAFEDGPAPEAGRAYTLRVEAPGYPPVVARSRAPLALGHDAAFVSGWERRDGGTVDGRPVVTYDDVALDVRLAPVPGGVYPLLSFTAVETEEDADGVRRRYGCSTSFFTGAPVLREATFVEDVQAGARRRLFEAFLDADALGPRPFRVEVEHPCGEVIRAEVAAASPEFYLAVRTRARAEAAERNPFAEPVPAYSNVEGGAGLFAGLTRRWVAVRRPD